MEECPLAFVLNDFPESDPELQRDSVFDLMKQIEQKDEIIQEKIDTINSMKTEIQWICSHGLKPKGDVISKPEDF